MRPPMYYEQVEEQQRNEAARESEPSGEGRVHQPYGAFRDDARDPAVRRVVGFTPSQAKP